MLHVNIRSRFLFVYFGIEAEIVRYHTHLWADDHLETVTIT